MSLKAKLLKTKVSGLDFWYREDDRFVGERIALGKYEEYETILMLKQVQHDSVVVDVGANIGYYTLPLAQKCKRVYAIEPDKNCFEILRKNIEVNNLKNVVPLNIAVSDKSEYRKIITDYKNRGNNRLSGKDCHAFDKAQARNNDMVKCERLDEILHNELKIDLIKIDTQGWEPQVIKGAKKIIGRDSPTLFLEYSPDEYEDKKMIEYLKSIYKNIWSIDFWFYICKKGIWVNKKTGYVDLWMKKDFKFKDYMDCVNNVQIKKVLKAIMKYV